MKKYNRPRIHNVVTAITLMSAFATLSALPGSNANATSLFSPQETKNVALPVVSEWLELIDGENYVKSWEERAAWFKTSTPPDQWLAAIQSIRVRVGTLQERKLRSRNEVITLPGMPDGEYVTFTDNRRFEKKHSAIETLTITKEKSGM